MNIWFKFSTKQLFFTRANVWQRWWALSSPSSVPLFLLSLFFLLSTQLVFIVAVYCCRLLLLVSMKFMSDILQYITTILIRKSYLKVLKNCWIMFILSEWVEVYAFWNQGDLYLFLVYFHFEWNDRKSRKKKKALLFIDINFLNWNNFNNKIHLFLSLQIIEVFNFEYL